MATVIGYYSGLQSSLSTAPLRFIHCEINLLAEIQ
ncbi:hypothetical protein T08_7949 [Trichinella sp. T8]|nr:hypothetical protein T08_7949 [Trichinella sp. T8]